MQTPVVTKYPILYQSVLWLAALALTVLGVYLSSIKFMQLEWLSRAGCLIVIIGIWSGLGGIIQERILLSRLQIRRRMAIARTKQKLRKKRVDNEYIDKEIEAVEEAFKEKSAQLAHALKFSVGILEVSLLILGTFLWGFGDLFILWIAP